jgi:hypothetical protein
MTEYRTRWTARRIIPTGSKPLGRYWPGFRYRVSACRLTRSGRYAMAMPSVSPSRDLALGHLQIAVIVGSLRRSATT